MNFQLTSLTCPVCGAPVTADSDRCDYCGSVLFLATDHPKINPANLNKQVVDKHIAEYRDTLRQNPHDTTAHYGLGVAYFNLRLTDDAVRELEEAARLMPENQHIQSQLAVVLKQAVDEHRPGAPAKLRDRIEYTLRLDPNNVDAMLLKAETDETVSNTDALKLLERAFALDPKRSKARYAAALIEMSGAPENVGAAEGLKLLEKALIIDPSGTDDQLRAAILKQAVDLSRPNPARDAVDPDRAGRSIDYWRLLHRVDADYASTLLHTFLAESKDIGRAEAKKLRELDARTGGMPANARQQRVELDDIILTASAASESIVMPVLKGVLKALGIVVLMFVVFAIILAALPDDSPFVDSFGYIVVLAILVLPVLMPILEVRKVRRKRKEERITISSRAIPTSAPLSGLAADSSFNELLRILKSYFMDRWDRETAARTQQDPDNRGARGERDRDTAFKTSLSR